MKPETKPKPKLPKIPAAPESRAPALAAEAWPVDRPKPYAKNEDWTPIDYRAQRAAKKAAKQKDTPPQ